MYENSLEEIEKAWKGFVEDGKLPTNINPMIISSWKRCKNYGVDPYGGRGTSVSKQKMDKVFADNSELLEIAIPIMENLNSLVLGTGFILVLGDKDGVILHIIGEDVIKKRGEQLLFQTGSLWSEKAVGTNAIGTCIVEKEPIQIIGAEHFCKTHHIWTCSAAPIRDKNGQVIGFIDMSGSSLNAHKHTLGIVVAAAYSIERQLHLSQSYAVINTIVNSISDGLLVVDKDNKINMINKVGEDILGVEGKDIVGIDVGNIINKNIFDGIENYKASIVWDFYINNTSITCTVQVRPINLRNNITGSIIIFKEIKGIQETVSTLTGNTAIYTFDSIISASKKMHNAIKQAEKFSRTRGCILIEGESGTGKELFAHSIHNYSNYKKGPFVAINCASLPKDLVESELFGYEKGAFTGAIKEGKIGKFELANGGTIFLDEIGELPLDLQAKLLRVLDDYTITRIGGKVPKQLNVRVVVATNRNLLEEVEKKNFREDLYYRLNVFRVTIPPLRERPMDVELLFNYFLTKLNRINNTDKKITNDFIYGFEDYSWSGNVRELENIIERAYYLSEEDTIGVELIPDEIMNRDMVDTEDNYLCIEAQEKKIIKKALAETNGHVVEASKLLGFSKSKLYRKINEYGIDSNKFKR